jgi:hypothetical protein
VALFQGQGWQDQEVLKLEQFAQITDRFDGVLLAGDGAQPVVDLPPCLRTAEPERLVDIGARLAQSGEPAGLGGVLDHQRGIV